VADEFVTIAKVVKTQGRIGEVAAELFTDFPERFESRTRLSALANDGSRRELQVEAFWPHKGRMVLKFAGVDSMNDAEALIGSELQVPRSERAELEPGAVYVSDLVGCSVTAHYAGGTREVGRIVAVEFSTGTAPLLIIHDANGKEYMVPFAEEFLAEGGMQLEQRRVEMVLPEGMLDLDAPLSNKERGEQSLGAADLQEGSRPQKGKRNRNARSG
jgi:16S rRNA processing protein RimM